MKKKNSTSNIYCLHFQFFSYKNIIICSDTYFAGIWKIVRACVCVSFCLWLYVSLCSCGYACVHKLGEVTDSPLVSLSAVFHSTSRYEVPQWTWQSLVSQQAPGASCLSFPCNKISSMWYHTQLCRWVPGIQLCQGSSCARDPDLGPRVCTVSILSTQPSPVLKIYFHD